MLVVLFSIVILSHGYRSDNIYDNFSYFWGSVSKKWVFYAYNLIILNVEINIDEAKRLYNY